MTQTRLEDCRPVGRQFQYPHSMSLKHEHHKTPLPTRHHVHYPPHAASTIIFSTPGFVGVWPCINLRFDGTSVFLTPNRYAYTEVPLYLWTTRSCQCIGLII